MFVALSFLSGVENGSLGKSPRKKKSQVMG
jgi:hypothetical protein